MPNKNWQFELEEYIKQGEPERAEKSEAWQTAIGLQAVDGLKTSDYLLDTAKDHIEGKITIDEAQRRIHSYYEQRTTRTETENETKEADIVSARITKLLGEKAFQFSPAEWITIHRRLFEGVFDHAGQIRQYNISKKEWILNGETVIYADWGSIKDTLDYDFATEKQFSYEGLSVEASVKHLAKFASDIWQIHPFGEGIAKWNSNYENEALQYKCKSLATIYNYFTINNNSVEISSSDDVYNFLSDEDVYSIEHFIVNGSGSTTYVDGKDNYELPDSVKKYSAYIFNFIFVPKSINNDIFKNYSVRTKMELLSKSNRTSEIKCEYSKMIIDIVKDMFADEVTITDLNDSEQKELDKYWLVTFKNEYSRFTSRVIDKLLDHFSNTHTDK